MNIQISENSCRSARNSYIRLLPSDPKIAVNQYVSLSTYSCRTIENSKYCY